MQLPRRQSGGRRAGAALAAAVLAALTLAACGSDNSSAETNADPADAGDTGDTADAFPVSLENTFGTTEIESPPEAVATVNWGNHDVPIALGIAPVGMQEATYGDDDGDGVLPWTHEALEELDATGDSLPALFDETDSLDFEGIANTAPDVILAAYSGLTKKDYTTLTEIAPTVSYPEIAWGTGWRDMATVNGEALGLKQEAEQKVAEVDQQIDDALAERPGVEGKTVAYTWIDPADTSSIWVYAPVDARVQLVGDLGMESSQGVVDLAGDGKEFGIQLTAENVDKIADADILVTYGDGSTLDKLRGDPLIGKLPAVERGSVVILSDNTPLAAATSGPTVLSIPWALEDYLDLFAEAAAKVE
jgi:iron complex transport system substrate-binding protein